jgi:adenosylcobinamide amidohydrolase
MRPDLTSLLDMPVLVWRPARPVRAIASGPLGGGIGPRHWVVNASVPLGYDRDDPDAHLREIATGLGLSGEGVGLLTAVLVGDRVSAEDGGVAVVATVGLREPTWAAAPATVPEHGPGTVNIVAHLPVRLSDAALVNAVATVTEAKVQALIDLAVPGTGTLTDATCVMCPPDGPAEAYGGPRSTWGAPLARAVYQAVLAGGRAYLRRSAE